MEEHQSNTRKTIGYRHSNARQTMEQYHSNAKKTLQTMAEPDYSTKRAESMCKVHTGHAKKNKIPTANVSWGYMFLPSTSSIAVLDLLETWHNLAAFAFSIV